MKFVGDLSRIISEAPVTDIGLLGNWDKPGGFKRGPDKALLTSAGRLDKIKQAWGRSEGDFRLFFAQFPGGTKYAEHGEMTDADRKNIEKRLGGQKLPEPVPDAVTVVFTNNTGNEWRAMTPWIIAHRLGHVLYRARLKDSNIEKDLMAFEKIVHRYLDEIGAAYGANQNHFESTIPSDRSRSGYAVTQEKMRLAAAHAAGAMRSARESNLRNVLEFTLETLAQYLITGKVKLADEHRPMVTGHSFGRPKQLRAKDAEALGTTKRDFAFEIPVYIDNIIDRAKGHVYLM